MPYLAIYLSSELGMSDLAIGWLMAGASLSIVISPVILTAIADTKLSGKQLLGLVFLVNISCMLLLAYFSAPWAAFVFFGIHVLLYVSVFPLLDGMNFTVQKLRRDKGLTTTPYNQIRIWGSIGFLLPSIFIYFLIEAGFTIGIILYATAFCALLSFLNTRRLPDFTPGANAEPKKAGSRSNRLPTLDAAAVLFKGRVLVFCIALALAHWATTAYMAFFPLYLTRTVGFSEHVAGLVFNLGALLEIFFLLGLGWAMRKFGLKWILVGGMAATALRLLVLAAYPTPAAAIITQILHGPIIIAIYIGPVLYLNHMASDRFRNSIQGLFTMAVVGLPRIAGSIWAGNMARQYPDLLLIYQISGWVCVGVAIILLVFFKPHENHPEV